MELTDLSLGHISYIVGIDIDCSNGETQLHREACICPGGLTGEHCESYLYNLYIYRIKE